MTTEELMDNAGGDAYARVMKAYADTLSKVPSISIASLVAVVANAPTGSLEKDADAVRFVLENCNGGGILRVCLMATLVTELEARRRKFVMEEEAKGASINVN